MSTCARPDLSCVIPALNEETRLPATLLAAADYARRAGLRLETIVVDDGSEDRTSEVAAAHGARVLQLGARCGPGVAARTGMLAARGERILLCDADGAVPFEDIAALSAALDSGADLAVGSRAQPGTIEVPQPMHRIWMGKAWGGFVRRVLPTCVRDTQCGFKLFAREPARVLFGQVRARGFAFHVEVIGLAARLGYSVAELPVRWRDQAGSKIRLVRDPLHMAAELMLTSWRFRHMSGHSHGSPREQAVRGAHKSTPMHVRRAS